MAGCGGRSNGIAVAPFTPQSRLQIVESNLTEATVPSRHMTETVTPSCFWVTVVQHPRGPGGSAAAWFALLSNGSIDGISIVTMTTSLAVLSLSVTLTL